MWLETSSSCFGSKKTYQRPNLYWYICAKHRGVRFHRIRDFKQYYFNSIPPTSQSYGQTALALSLPLCTSIVASPPSSTSRSAPPAPCHVRHCSVHHQYSCAPGSDKCGGGVDDGRPSPSVRGNLDILNPEPRKDGTLRRPKPSQKTKGQEAPRIHRNFTKISPEYPLPGKVAAAGASRSPPGSPPSRRRPRLCRPWPPPPRRGPGRSAGLRSVFYKISIWKNEPSPWEV